MIKALLSRIGMTCHGILVVVRVHLLDVIEIVIPVRSGLWNVVEFVAPVVIRLRHIVVFVLQRHSPSWGPEND